MADLGRRASDNATADQTLQNAKDIAGLQSDIENMGKIFSRLDLAIEKIGDLSNTIIKMLAVHDQRLDDQVKVNEDLYNAVHQTQQDLNKDQREISQLLNSIQNNLNLVTGTFEGRVATLVEEKTREIHDRISKLERWRWMMGGAGVVVGAILGWLVPAIFEMFGGPQHPLGK
jgi:septal ring factor EnvC (AmiA/AmiB activator)